MPQVTLRPKLCKVRLEKHFILETSRLRFFLKGTLKSPSKLRQEVLLSYYAKCHRDTTTTREKKKLFLFMRSPLGALKLRQPFTLMTQSKLVFNFFETNFSTKLLYGKKHADQIYERQAKMMFH